MSSPPSVTVSRRGRARVSPSELRELGRRAQRALTAAGLDGDVALSLTDDRELRALNRDYAGEDHATDVLSFSQREGDHARARGPLGDVIISVPTARRQARAGNRPLADELLHLAVHGLAHLAGYDHATPADERVMFAYEAKLRQIAAARGPIKRVRRPQRENVA